MMEHIHLLEPHLDASQESLSNLDLKGGLGVEFLFILLIVYLTIILTFWRGKYRRNI